MDWTRPSAGSRDEGSVAFSLRALMAQEEALTRGRAGREAREVQLESGLIDLNALGKEAGQVAAHLAVFPFGAPTPTAPTTEPSVAAPAPRRGSVGKVVAIATAMVLAAAGGAFAGLRASEAAPRPVAVAGLAEAARASVPHLPEAPAAPAATDTTAAPAPEAPEATTKAAPPAAPAWRAPAAQPRDRAATTSPPPRTPPAATTSRDKAPPAPDPCGGDLLCAMRRATHG